jgi:integrase
MPAIVVELLRASRSQQVATRLQASAVWTDLDLVFTDARGYPHNHDRVRLAFYKALDAAGVRRVVLDAPRNTMATLVLHETNDLKLVATRLGHSNAMLTLRAYGHLLPAVDREAADGFGEVVKRGVRDEDKSAP